MALPTVVIVGRPNVGKSSLLNALARRRISIVDPTAGVTRDRIMAICEMDDRYFEVVDTGGHGIEDADNLTDDVESQIRVAIAMADLVLFVVDVREGITPLDTKVAELLRAANKPVKLIANKADVEQHDPAAGELQRLGFGEAMCISALHGRGRRELMEWIIEFLGERIATEMPEPVMKLAIVGRRNVGKSTFVNAMAGQERVIVSEVPGTTRDAVDVRFQLDGREYLAIDTAGVKKVSKHKTGVEFYSHHRALLSVRRADVVLFLIDASANITEVDKKLAAEISEHFKPVVLVVNKWDLAKGKASAEDYGSYLTKTLPELAFAPIAFTTAIEAKNIQSTIDLAASLFKQAQTRVTTGQLNRAIAETLGELQPAASKLGAEPKIYFATQISVCPPTIVFFVNQPALVRENYRRFMAKRFREMLPFPEIPVRFVWRVRKSGDVARAGASDD